MLSDLRIAYRGLRRSAAFTLLALVTLSLGIGANATIFSIVNSVLLRPLAGFETHRLMRIQDAGHGSGLGFVDPEAFKRVRAASKSFEELAGMQVCQFALTGQAEPEQVWGPCVTANWFRIQRAQPLLGRTFLPGEDQPGKNRVVVLEHGFWQRRFGGAADIVGQTILLDKTPWTVIGVMPADFKPVGATASAIFTPYVLDENAAGLYVTGRLKPGVTEQEAVAELRVLTKQLQAALPRFEGLELKATTALEDVTGPAAPLLRLLLGAVALVLVIACVNLANLLLARSGARQKEMDIRVALGASRWRLVRFLIAESLLICIAAASAAVGLAYLGLRLSRPLMANLPRTEEIAVDFRVFAICLTAGVATAVLFGLVPLIGRSLRWGQCALVATEVALAFVLLVGSGLLLRTFAAMREASLGYDSQNVLTHFYSQPPSVDGSRTAGLAMYGRLRGRIAAVPGVLDVATASTLPMGGVTMTMDVQPEGQAVRRTASRQAVMAVVSDHYFRTVRIPLRAGRTFAATDREGTTPVVAVSDAIAKRYFGGNALGRRIVLPRLEYNVAGNGEVHAEIVGVTGNVCVNSVSDCDVEHIYLPESQNGLRMAYLLIRASGDPLSIASAVKRAAAEESPLVPLDQPQTLEQRTGYLTADVRQGMWLIGVFAGLAVLLAASGVYGVSTYLASLRRKEMGVRAALGATMADIAGLIYRQTLIMALAGLAVGVVAAGWLAHFLEAMLFKVGPRDPSTLGIATAGLVVIVFLAATPPALRSAMVDPARELRRE